MAHSLKVWMGSVKLDNTFPTHRALQQLLYGSEGGSAEDADVIALFMTDLLLTNDNVDSYRHMLKKALRRPEEYIVNEADRNLLIRHIPAQLVKTSEVGGRFVSMSVAVHRRNVPDAQRSLPGPELRPELPAEEEHRESFECFPTPVMFTCKSPRKNVNEPSFKGIMAQFVVLRRGEEELDLLLLGANLDAQHESKLAQLEAMERFVHIRRPGPAKFCALMFGDFNNRLVAFEELRPVMEARSGRHRWELQDGAVEMLVGMLQNPVQRRELLKKDAAVFAGCDVNGQQCELSKCNEKLRAMFKLHVDWPDLEVPLPSYKVTPLDYHLSQEFGCRLRLEDVVVIDDVHTNTAKLETILSDLEERYFGWGRRIKAFIGDDGESENMFLQSPSWPDGVGIYRGSTAAGTLRTWEADDSILAYDHLPLRSLVSVRWDEADCDLKVWLGFMKLDNKFPTRQALQHLLYSSPTTSAAGADIVALFLTDLVLTNENVDSLRHMLRNALSSPEEYILNEEDPNLNIRHIPAQLVKPGEQGGRYVAMPVAVHRRNVEDCNDDQVIDNFDCFLMPVHLTCKSPRKNELEPSFKAVLEQEVMLSRGAKRLDLVLLGANLDSHHGPKLSQLEAVHRLLRARARSNPFCAVIWGDLNNRLVAYEELGPHVCQPRPGLFDLRPSGAALLAELIKDPEGRRSLLMKDALVYDGRDVGGRQCEVSRCSTLMSKIFRLHIHEAQDRNLEVPLPFYKHTPPDHLLSECLGCRLRLEDVALADRLRGATLENASSLRDRYFGWQQGGRSAQRVVKPDVSADGLTNTYLQLGWLDGIGIYRGGTAAAKLLAWETEDHVLAFDHVPLRAVAEVRF